MDTATTEALMADLTYQPGSAGFNMSWLTSKNGVRNASECIATHVVLRYLRQKGLPKPDAIKKVEIMNGYVPRVAQTLLELPVFRSEQESSPLFSLESWPMYYYRQVLEKDSVEEAGAQIAVGLLKDMLNHSVVILPEDQFRDSHDWWEQFATSKETV